MKGERTGCRFGVVTNKTIRRGHGWYLSREKDFEYEVADECGRSIVEDAIVIQRD